VGWTGGGARRAQVHMALTALARRPRRLHFRRGPLALTGRNLEPFHARCVIHVNVLFQAAQEWRARNACWS
jgi:hypothetical protein